MCIKLRGWGWGCATEIVTLYLWCLTKREIAAEDLDFTFKRHKVSFAQKESYTLEDEIVACWTNNGFAESKV